jgi:broad specificity phosphatase PhoE
MKHMAVVPRIALGMTLFLTGLLHAQSGKATTVIVVRHAEKAAQPAADPPLTEEGQARARALWEAVKDANVGAIITTQLARTMQTAAPTASTRHIVPEVVPTTGADHPARVAAAVRRHAGQTVLVVGHSNTVPAIIASLGAKEPPAICDPEYDGFYVVTIAADGSASVIRSRYGVLSPPASCAAPK